MILAYESTCMLYFTCALAIRFIFGFIGALFLLCYVMCGIRYKLRKMQQLKQFQRVSRKTLMNLQYR